MEVISPKTTHSVVYYKIMMNCDVWTQTFNIEVVTEVMQ